MNLIKTSLLTGISTIIKIITGLIINKIIAIYVGPSGLGQIGQFQNFISIATSLANGSINQGVTKYTAEYYDDKVKRSKILSTSVLFCFINSLIIALILLVFNRQISILILKNENYGSLFIIFAVTLILFALNTYFLAVLNGYREIKKFVTVNMISSIVSLVFSSILMIKFGLYGALLSLATSQTIVFFVTIIFVVKSEWFKLENFTRGIDKESLIKLAKFASMILISSLIGPITYILIRSHIANTISLDAAGYWQGICKISDIYLMLITSSLSVYYLPKLSAIKNNEELRKEIFSGYKIILPIVGIMALGIFLGKDIIIRILFTNKFLVMSNLFAFQLIGDFLKITSWLLSYIMIAKAMIKRVIITEILFYILYLIFSYVFINKFGLIGVTYAFALDYFIYLLIMIYFFKDLLISKFSTSISIDAEEIIV